MFGLLCGRLDSSLMLESIWLMIVMFRFSVCGVWLIMVYSLVLVLEL